MRVYEIMDFKKQLELTTETKQNKHTLHQHYSGVKMAESSEEVSVAFIEVANMLYNSMLASSRIQKLLFQLDQMRVNPLDSVNKLREIAVQCDKKEPMMHWVLTLLADWWLHKDGKDPIPVRSLKEARGDADCSIIRVMQFKKQIRDKLLRMVETDFPAWETKVKNDIRTVTDSVESVRTNLGYYDSNEDQKTYPARGTWPESADRFLLAFEALVYGYNHDSLMYQMLKNRKGVDDVLDHQTLQ